MNNICSRKRTTKSFRFALVDTEVRNRSYYFGYIEKSGVVSQNVTY